MTQVKRLRSMKLLAVCAAAGLLLVSGAVSTADAHGDHGRPRSDHMAITVMTRNVYLGADVQRPIEAIQSATSPQDLVVRLGNATHVTRAIVDQTDFGTRRWLLAAEIERTRPDLIGLQEVALWRSGPLQLDQLAVPNAEHVDYDFLDLLLDALAERGEDYRAVSVRTGSDVEAPSFTGSPFDGTISGDPRDVRLTVRDVVLMREGSRLSLRDSGTGDFTHNLSVDVAGRTLEFTRGFNWVDVRAGWRTLRFVNTHLEAFSSDLAYAQAAELLLGPASQRRTTIIGCDCNSDPLNSDIKGPPVNDKLPHKAAYDLITGPGGFTDQWLRWRPAEEGFTSGLNETVDEPTPSFTHRIDMVFARTRHGDGLPVRWGAVTGDELSDRDPETGLWPSDHAGVVLRLALGQHSRH